VARSGLFINLMHIPKMFFYPKNYKQRRMFGVTNAAPECAVQIFQYHIITRFLRRCSSTYMEPPSTNPYSSGHWQGPCGSTSAFHMWGVTSGELLAKRGTHCQRLVALIHWKSSNGRTYLPLLQNLVRRWNRRRPHHRQKRARHYTLPFAHP
jgi:hypothetical protein